MRWCGATAQQLLVLLVLLVASAGVCDEDIQPPLEIEMKVEVNSDSAVACTVDQLVPPHDQDISDMWDKDTLVPPSFDCTCRTLKARCVLCFFFLAVVDRTDRLNYESTSIVDTGLGSFSRVGVRRRLRGPA